MSSIFKVTSPEVPPPDNPVPAVTAVMSPLPPPPPPEIVIVFVAPVPVASTPDPTKFRVVATVANATPSS